LRHGTKHICCREVRSSSTFYSLIYLHILLLLLKITVDCSAGRTSTPINEIFSKNISSQPIQNKAGSEKNFYGRKRYGIEHTIAQPQKQMSFSKKKLTALVTWCQVLEKLYIYIGETTTSPNYT